MKKLNISQSQANADRYRAMSMAYQEMAPTLKQKNPKIKNRKGPKTKKRCTKKGSQTLRWPRATRGATEMAEKRKKLERTPAEKAMQVILEECLWPKHVNFAAEVAVIIYIADFYVFGHRIVIEVDGEYHFFRERYDRTRNRAMKADGIRVLRFTNHEVLTDPMSVRNAVMTCVFGKHEVTI